MVKCLNLFTWLLSCLCMFQLLFFSRSLHWIFWDSVYLYSLYTIREFFILCLRNSFYQALFFSFLIVELHVYENELYKLVGTFCYYNIGYLERCKGIVGHMNLTEKYFLLCFPFHIQFSCVSNFRSCCHHTFLECGHTRMEITNLSG